MKIDVAPCGEEFHGLPSLATPADHGFFTIVDGAGEHEVAVFTTGGHASGASLFILTTFAANCVHHGRPRERRVQLLLRVSARAVLVAREVAPVPAVRLSEW